MSARPSICPPVHIYEYQRGYHWTNFRQIWYWGLLSTFIEKNPHLLKIEQNYQIFYAKTYLSFTVAGDIEYLSYKDATSPKQWVQALNKPRAHTTHVRHKAIGTSWGAQSTTITLRHIPKVHKHLSHTYNNDPLVHHDHMIFTCILTNFYNMYFITNAL